MTVSVRHLVGSEDELAALVDLLGTPEESFAAAVVIGEAGIGKTTLSSAAVEAAARFSFVGLADLIGGVVADVFAAAPSTAAAGARDALALSESESSVVSSSRTSSPPAQ